MKIKNKPYWVMILSALMALALCSTVYAEGEEPGSTPYENPVVEVQGNPSPAPENEPVAVDTTSIEDTGTGSSESIVPDESTQDENGILEEDISPEEISGDLIPEESTTPELVNQEVSAIDLVDAPIEPAVSLADQSGQVLNPAAQVAAELTSGADPYFYVGAVKYQFLQSGGSCDPAEDGVTCFVSAPGGNPISDAITYIKNNADKIPTDGTIYVEQDIYSGNIVIDGIEPNLTFMKGLVGLANSSNVFPTINGDVTISNLLSGFTLSGFIITGGVSLENNTGVLNMTDLDVANSSGTGLTVSGQNGNITITRVKSSGNSGDGMDLQNDTAGNVTVTNSACDDNDSGAGIGNTAGLRITTKGIITINGFSGSRNNGFGLYTSGFSKMLIKNSVFNSNFDSLDSGSAGMGIDSQTSKVALITLESVYANENE